MHHGDCLEYMRTLPDGSADSMVVDPPYGLGKPPPIEVVLRAWLAGEAVEVSGGGFMGKDWDAFVPHVEYWREAFRVLKPGSYAVVFAGQRTVDVMGVALRLAGFEVRDLLGWQFWSGFPKNHCVSTAIDRVDGVMMTRDAQLRATAWMRSTGITSKQINEATGTNMASHYLTDKSQPAIPTMEHLDTLRPMLPSVPEWLEVFARRRSIESENMKRREVVGTKKGADPKHVRLGMPGQPASSHDYNITAPATPDARKWSGYGTALKPCIEPALLIRRPLPGTVAANVLTHGVGALNIDGCRYPFGDAAWPGPQDGAGGWAGAAGFTGALSGGTGLEKAGDARPVAGRWPSNVYACPKVSTRERERGCDGLPLKSAGELVDRDPDSAAMDSPRTGAGRQSSGRRNSHPTLKPVRLLRWLTRLVTPPGGVVLDPFAGSGSCGVAASLEGFEYLGAELQADYHRIAAARIAHAKAWPGEWADTEPGSDRKTNSDEPTPRELEEAGQVTLF